MPGCRDAGQFVREASTEGGQLAVESLQQVAGEIDDALPADADPQVDGQQFGIGQDGGPWANERSQWSFAFGPVR